MASPPVTPPSPSVRAMMRSAKATVAEHYRAALTVCGIWFLVSVVLRGSLAFVIGGGGSGGGGVGAAASLDAMTSIFTNRLSALLLGFVGAVAISFGVASVLRVVHRGLGPRAALVQSLAGWRSTASIAQMVYLRLVGVVVFASVLVLVLPPILFDLRTEPTPATAAMVFALAVVPCLWILVSLSVALAVAVLEDSATRPALERARALLRGNRASASTFYGATVLAAGAVVFGTAVLTGGDASFAGRLAIAVTAILGQAVAASGLAVLYEALTQRQRTAHASAVAEVFE